MKTEELRDMTLDELMDALVEAKEERFNLRFQVATNQIDNTARLKTVKKDIARIRTVLRERELADLAASADGTASADTGETGASVEAASARRRRTKETA